MEDSSLARAFSPLPCSFGGLCQAAPPRSPNENYTNPAAIKLKANSFPKSLNIHPNINMDAHTGPERERELYIYIHTYNMEDCSLIRDQGRLTETRRKTIRTPNLSLSSLPQSAPAAPYKKQNKSISLSLSLSIYIYTHRYG